MKIEIKIITLKINQLKETIKELKTTVSVCMKIFGLHFFNFFIIILLSFLVLIFGTLLRINA